MTPPTNYFVDITLPLKAGFRRHGSYRSESERFAFCLRAKRHRYSHGHVRLRLLCHRRWQVDPFPSVFPSFLCQQRWAIACVLFVLTSPFCFCTAAAVECAHRESPLPTWVQTAKLLLLSMLHWEVHVSMSDACPRSSCAMDRTSCMMSKTRRRMGGMFRRPRSCSGRASLRTRTTRFCG